MIQSLGQIMAANQPGSFSDRKQTFIIDGIKIVATSRQADRLKQQIRAMKRGLKLTCPRCDAFDIHPIRHLQNCAGIKRR